MKRKKKKINAENAANNNVENKLRELGVELNTDATKLNNLSRLLSALISSSPPPSLRKGRDDDLFKVDHEKDEEEKKKQSVHQKEKWSAFSPWRNSSARDSREATWNRRNEI